MHMYVLMHANKTMIYMTHKNCQSLLQVCIKLGFLIRLYGIPNGIGIALMLNVMVILGPH